MKGVIQQLVFIQGENVLGVDDSLAGSQVVLPTPGATAASLFLPASSCTDYKRWRCLWLCVGPRLY